MPTELERRILVYAPTSRDSELTCRILREQGMAGVACPEVQDLVREMRRGVGAVLVCEEMFVKEDVREFAEIIDRQPAWSDLPIILITHHESDAAVNASITRRFGNVMLLERPTRLNALSNVAQSALRARRRQFETRDLIIAREEALQALQESENRFRLLVEQVKDYAIFMIDLEGRATSWNEGVHRVLGFEEAEFVHMDVSERIFTPEDVEQGVPLAELREAASTGTAGNDRWMRRKDGSRFWASGVTTALRDVHGQHIGYTKIMRDLTVNKQAEEALQQADRRKDEFLATLAHELRNPLAPLRNSVNILQLTASGDPTTERLCATMDRQVNHLVRLVDDLLEVSRITRGKIELRKERIELSAVARNALEASRPLIECAGVQLAISLPEDPVMLDADPVRLGQVLSNLLNNAAKYTPEGGQIWFTARIENDEAVLSVRDTGIGIAKEVLPKIFEMFMQVNGGASRFQGGLGIGLTLVQSLVEMHGGRVTASSEGPDRGSEFVVRLPLASGVVKSLPSPTRTSTSNVLSSRRILVVDDNVDSANTLGVLLQYLGAEVKVVHSGPAALEAIEESRPDVVLLDLGMPEMDGFEVAQQIRQRREFESVTLIALTGWGQESDQRRTREAGFNHHLVKPADITQLQALLVSP